MSNKNRLIILVLSSLAFLLLAASTPGVGMVIESTNTLAFPQVEVRLSAWNAEGLPLQDLQPDNFLIQENGEASFIPDQVKMDQYAPLSVALVLDISGSMYGQPIEDARVAAARFLDRLTPGDQAALLAFSDNLDPDPLVLNTEREQAFTANLAPIYDRVEILQAQGGTHLYNAVTKAVAMTQALPSGHRAILVLSDGVNEPADVGDPDLPIEIAQEAKIPIYVIGLGSRIDEPYLRRLTSETGGVLRLAPRSSELAQTFDEIASLLKTQYTLVYTSRITNGAPLLDLDITMKALGAEVKDQLQLSNLPALPTSTPEPSPTPTQVLPTATQIPPEPTLIPTLMPTILPTEIPPTGLLGFIQGLPLIAWLIPLGIFALIAFLLIRHARRKKVVTEKCARCGYTLPDGADVCPQCGETRHYSVGKK